MTGAKRRFFIRDIPKDTQATKWLLGGEEAEFSAYGAELSAADFSAIGFLTAPAPMTPAQLAAFRRAFQVASIGCQEEKKVCSQQLPEEES